MKFLLCLLPVIVQARITIDIHASQNMPDSAITTKGSSHNTITDQDRKNFNLNETTLKNGVYKLTGSKRTPTDTYLRSPTPWNDLYKSYAWKEVTTILKPMKTRVVNIEKEMVVLNKKETANNGTEAKVQKLAMTAKVEDSVTSYWEKNTKPFEADIDYNINFKGIGNITKFNLNSTWGAGLLARDVGIDSPTFVQVRLQPKQNATVVLTATKVTVEIGVTYMAILDGTVATNYEERFEGHHFWAHDIASVMEGIDNIPQNVTAEEFIVLEFYDDLRTTIHDI